MAPLFPMFSRFTRAFFIFASVALVVTAAPFTRAALTVARFFPAAGATDVCPDTPLRLTFSAAPTLGAGGKIRVCDATTKTVVETIDLSAPTATKTIGGLEGYKYYTVIVSGRDATLYPKPGALAYHQSYCVMIDAGAFQSGTEVFTGLDEWTAWHFTTKTAPPPAHSLKLTVAADGSGDFCTVQGALDFIPDGNTAPTTIFVRNGTYTEIVFFTNKHAVTILGEDRRQTIIAYANNANFNGSGGNPFANRANPSGENPKQGGSVYRRGLFLAHRVNDFTLAHLTMRNTTPQGGSQAEALIVNGTTEARTILRDVDFYGYQDTVQINGQAYISDCRIEGDVDFMWGTGPSFFENCTLRTLRSGAFYTQIRNPGTNHGFVYRHCAFETAPGVVDNCLSRIEPRRFPHSEVVLLDCVLAPGVSAIGWQLQADAKNPEPASNAGIHFWEFNSRTPAGKPVDVSQRLAVSRQLTLPEDASLIENYQTPAFVLGHDWNPQLAPIFR